MTKFKKGIALLLSLVMCLSVMCVSAFADGDEDPEGAEAAPVTTAEVSTLDQLSTALANENITSITLTGTIRVEGGATVTLAGHGQTITAGFDNYAITVTGDNSNLALSNVVINCVKGINVTTGTDVSATLTDVTVHGSKVSLIAGRDSNVTVNGGEYDCGSWGYAANVDTGAAVGASGGSLTVEAGTIHGIAMGDKNGPNSLIINGGSIDWVASWASDAVTVNGGTIVGDGLDSGYVQYWGKAAIVGANKVCRIFATLAAAIDAADNETVTLVQSVAEDITIPENKTVILNLNGESLSNSSSDTISVYGNLTIRGNGTVKTVVRSKGAIVNYTTGVVALEGGTIEQTVASGWYTIKNMGAMSIEDGVTVTTASDASSLVANGWYGNAATDRNVSGVADTAKLTINGGSFSNGLIVIKNDDYGILNIYDGEFTTTGSTNYCLVNWNVTNIYGGTFNAVPTVLYNGYGGAADLGQLTIDGGEFNVSAGGNILDDYSSTPATILNGVFSTADEFNGVDVGTLENGKFVVGAKEHVAAVEPNYARGGNSEYWTIGDYYFSDEACEHQTTAAAVNRAQLVMTFDVSPTVTSNTSNNSSQEQETVEITDDATPLAALPESLAEVTVTVTNEAGETVEVSVSELPTTFADVAETSYARDAIAYVEALGLMNGVGNNADGNATFAPQATTTSEMLTTVLYRAVSGEETSGENWAESATAWAAGANLTDGLGLEAGKDVTREQMVTMMYRVAEAKGFDVSAAADLDGYTDADGLSDFALAAMKWAVSVGLINGTDVDKLSPDSSVTREQIATILMRFNEMTKDVA